MKPEEAIITFEKTLATMGRSTTIFWLFKENCLITLDTIYFTWDSSLNQEHSILPAHEEANSKNIGVQYTCISEFNGMSLCYQWVPGDKVEMEQCMISLEGKYSVLVRPFNIYYSNSKLKFKFKTCLRKPSQIMDEIPSRRLFK